MEEYECVLNSSTKIGEIRQKGKVLMTFPVSDLDKIKKALEKPWTIKWI